MGTFVARGAPESAAGAAPKAKLRANEHVDELEVKRTPRKGHGKGKAVAKPKPTAPRGYTDLD